MGSFPFGKEKRMFYRICDHIALRSWEYVPFAFYVRNKPYAIKLEKEEFSLMLLCDGEYDLADQELLKDLEQRGLIETCRRGEHPSRWSEHRSFPHRYFPKMNLMITGKCNYNCLHCFNAADNAPLMAEWSYEDLTELLDQARDCGVHAFTITGGEPMLHPHFEEILRGIIDREMFVEELNTNGFFIRQEILDRMAAMGCRPLMKISFDGIGCHDWMRARKGAETRTLSAIRLCIENGFSVMVQMQVNRRTLDSLLPTLNLLEKEGVSSVRLIRTTEVERWEMNGGDAALSLSEYYEKMLTLAAAYRNGDHRMPLDIWQFLRIHPVEKKYDIPPVKCAAGEYRKNLPMCSGNRGMVAVTAEGDVVPCLQLSGFYKDHGITLGNVHESKLRDLLTAGRYMETVCATVSDLKDNNSKCASCCYFEYCCGGCPGMGMVFSGDEQNMYGTDISKCLFFENGWFERINEAFRDWECLTPIPPREEIMAQWRYRQLQWN